MQLTDFELCADLTSNNKIDIIKELIQILVDRKKIRQDDFNDVFDAVIKRELSSTYMGNGVAIPHAKCPVLEKFIGIVGVTREAADDSKLFFLVLSPVKNAGEYLKTLATLSISIKDDCFLECLKNAKDEYDMRKIIFSKSQKTFNNE